MRVLLVLVFLLAMGPIAAQESANYRLSEHVFNAGGHPDSGQSLASSGFRITLDAVGEGVVGTGLESEAYRMDGGFGAGYPPPGEVLGLRFLDHETLAWDPERSVGTYNLYRDLLSALSGLEYGQCEQQDLSDETTTHSDIPPTSNGYMYLLTASNRIAEEGTKGRDSQGDERPNPNPCP